MKQPAHRLSLSRSSYALLGATFALALVATACKKGGSTAASNADAGATAATNVTSAKEATPKEAGTKFAKKSLAAGQKRTDTSTTDTAMKISMMGKTGTFNETEATKKDEEILEVANDAITKLRVRYAQSEKTRVEDGKPAKAKTNAVAGKTYIIALKNGKTTVLTDKEKPAPKNEAKLVERDYTTFGKPDPMLAAMPDRALEDGEEVPTLAEAIKTAIATHQKSTNEREKMSIDSAKVVFKGKDGDRGIFDLALTMKLDAGSMKATMPLTGTMNIRTADSWPTSMTLEGPIAIDVTDKEKKAAGIEGSGTIKIGSTYAYP